MPKDNEKIPLLDVGPLAPSERRAFAPEQMVQCEACLRSNPPTRMSCIYCGAALALEEKTADLKKPTYKPVEQWERGYSNVVLGTHKSLSDEACDEAASFLKLSPLDLQRIIISPTPLPVTHVSTIDEAQLFIRRLSRLGLITRTISDRDLAIDEDPPVRIRAADLTEAGMMSHVRGSAESHFYEWSDIVLLVHGRLVTKNVEVNERKGGGKNQILDSTETYTDAAVVDIYTSNANLRITSNSFNFSCLGDRKGLLAEENFGRLLELICEFAPAVSVDDTYKSAKLLLDLVWFAESKTESRGWRHEGLGRYSVGVVAESSNEPQFTRYSRLRHYLHINSISKSEFSDQDPV